MFSFFCQAMRNKQSVTPSQIASPCGFTLTKAYATSLQKQSLKQSRKLLHVTYFTFLKQLRLLSPIFTFIPIYFHTKVLYISPYVQNLIFIT
jgi:hypothetical protein